MSLEWGLFLIQPELVPHPAHQPDRLGLLGAPHVTGLVPLHPSKEPLTTAGAMHGDRQVSTKGSIQLRGFSPQLGTAMAEGNVAPVGRM